jgi:hypothetical protein
LAHDAPLQPVELNGAYDANQALRPMDIFGL